jgi:hypothetical protein
MAYDEQHDHADRYFPAIEGYKMANAKKSKAARWMAEDATRAVLVEKMYKSSNSFISTMLTNYADWGSLTAGQEAAVRKIFAKEDERKAAWKAADAASVFVGEVGKRQDFTLTMQNHFSYETDFGMLHIHILKDEAGNVVVYKGSKYLEAARGDAVKGKATVKDHSVREGVNQTIVSRPKFEKVV